ncbi:hypothetical protein PIB30_083259, partial [Stylosanthes scabra]|nr:hypothetical protein [Stylosanthes scabra]
MKNQQIFQLKNYNNYKITKITKSIQEIITEKRIEQVHTSGEPSTAGNSGAGAAAKEKAEVADLGDDIGIESWFSWTLIGGRTTTAHGAGLPVGPSMGAHREGGGRTAVRGGDERRRGWLDDTRNQGHPHWNCLLAGKIGAVKHGGGNSGRSDPHRDTRRNDHGKGEDRRRERRDGREESPPSGGRTGANHSLGRRGGKRQTHLCPNFFS